MPARATQRKALPGAASSSKSADVIHRTSVCKYSENHRGGIFVSALTRGRGPALGIKGGEVAEIGNKISWRNGDNGMARVLEAGQLSPMTSPEMYKPCGRRR